MSYVNNAVQWKKKWPLSVTQKKKKQEAQLSQRNRATLRVIECFASHSSSLKVIRNDTVE